MSIVKEVEESKVETMSELPKKQMGELMQFMMQKQRETQPQLKAKPLQKAILNKKRGDKQITESSSDAASVVEENSSRLTKNKKKPAKEGKQPKKE